MINTLKIAATLFLAIGLAVSVGNPASVEADNDFPAIGAFEVTLGPNEGEVTLSWEGIDRADFYVIAWIAYGDYRADNEAGRNWRDSITYRSINNSGQNSYTVTRLTPGELYAFRIGSNSGRYGAPEWLPWSGPVRLSGGPQTCARDRAALTALYNATDGANWRNDANWLDETAPLDEWFGVLTDNHGCVLVLYLPSNDLAGAIPAEMADMPRLRVLHLSSNELSGEIPPGLAGLGDLRVLNLYNNELSGEIPPDLGSMPNLSTISLSRNELTGKSPLS